MNGQRVCIYVYAPGSDCWDVGCDVRGGRCQYVGPPGRDACRCLAVTPSPNRLELSQEAMMTKLDWLEKYQSMVEQQPAFEETWFLRALERFRSGEESAGREISARCLRLALRVAEEAAANSPKGLLLELVEEANAGIVDALGTFEGSTGLEFQRHVEQAIQHRLLALPA